MRLLTFNFEGIRLHGPTSPSPVYPSIHLHVGGRRVSYGTKQAEFCTLQTTSSHVRSFKYEKDYQYNNGFMGIKTLNFFPKNRIKGGRCLPLYIDRLFVHNCSHKNIRKTQFC